MENFNIYEKVNNTIIEKLESGKIPWRQPFAKKNPQNFITKKYYHGINFVLLSSTDFASNYFMTFLQCKNLGGSIKSGSKGVQIIFYKLFDFKELNSDLVGKNIIDKKFPLIQYSNVFNLQQTSLYSEDLLEDPQFLEADNIINNVKNLVLKNNFSRACYKPIDDYITIPTMLAFNTADEYYSTLFHELVHWTGHPSRLNRFSLDPNSFKFDDNYSFEELVAEIGSAYLCNIANIVKPEILTNQSAYIQGWLEKLKNDKKLIFKASSEAQKAVNYILKEETK